MHPIQKDVKDMYELYPYPSDPRAFLRYSTSLTEIDICAKENWENFRDKKILDFGCGTGEIVNGLAKRIPHCIFDGMDMTAASLTKAKLLKEKERITNLNLINGDLNSLANNRKDYDEIISIGVLHATPSAKESFNTLSKSLKDRGSITIALYSAYGRLWNRIKRWLLKLFIGDNVEKRMNLVKKIYGSDLNETEMVRLADRYAHPQETYHTISEVLSWFKRNNIKYIGSYPPIELYLYPKLFYLKWKYRNRSLAERDGARFEYIKNTNVSNFWHNKLFYFIVQLIWMMYLKSNLFFIRGQKL